MKYAILIAFFSFVLSARPANAQTETLFLQQFTLADGSVLHAKISTTSLEYLYERNQAPDYVWQNFGNLWSIVKVSALFWKAEEAKADELTFKEVVERYLSYTTDRFGSSYKTLHKVIQCESQFKNENVWGKAGEYGILQFMQGTFNAFEKDANLGNLEWKNWQDQILLGSWAFANGKASHWTCFKLTAR